MERDDDALDVPGPSRDGKTRPTTTFEHVRVQSPFSRGSNVRKSIVSEFGTDEPRFNLDNYRAWVRRQRKKARENVWVRLENGFNAWYQRWIIERLLRQYVMPSWYIPPRPMVDGRADQWLGEAPHSSGMRLGCPRLLDKCPGPG